MSKYKFVTLLYLSLTFKMKAEVFSSIYKMELLLTTQKNIIDTLNIILSTKNYKNKILNNYLHRFESEHTIAMLDIPRYIGNPVNCYRLIKRFTVDIKTIEKVLIGISEYKRNKSVTYPSKADMMGAARGMLQIESTYGLNKSLIAAGIWNTSYNIDKKPLVEIFNPMTISDCYELGKILYNSKQYKDSKSWLIEALKKYKDELSLYPEDSHVLLEDIVKKINQCYVTAEEEDKNFQNWVYDISLLIPNFEKVDLQFLVHCYQNRLKESETIELIETNFEFSTPVFNFTSAQLNETYTALCKGEIRNQDKIFKKAKCYLAHGPHPFLKLAPLKAELLSRAPLVILYHEVISEPEIKALKEHASPRLTRAPAFNPNFDTSYHRICQGAQAKSNESSIAARIKTRIEQFSGMTLTESEELEVLNYGIGGLCAAHYDYWDNDTYTALMGERIATVHFYISDVEQGGATVFPILGTAVFPIKGAALYWVNLLPSGRGDPRTYHAACPVLRGSKWIVSQWINLRGQELSRPCPVNSKPTSRRSRKSAKKIGRIHF